MKASRLARLAALTHGAALLGAVGAASLGSAGCERSSSNEQPTRPPVMNSPTTATASAPVAAADADGGAFADRRRRFPILNAPPRLQGDDSDGGATPSR